jgi:SAM-dependent methyltransferase
VTRSCPVCGDDQSSRKFEARDAHYGIEGSWWVRECGACGSFFLESPPSQAELEQLYGADYYAYEIASPSKSKRLLHALLGYSTATRDPELPTQIRMLDFGCGAGEYLLRARKKGWSAFGVENNARAREVAARHGLDVRPTLLGADGFKPESFDYLRANHSLEHVLNPAETLADMWTALKPGGRLFIGVPTASSENARLFGASWWHVTAPLHTFIPSSAGLRGLVEAAGFRVDAMSTNGTYAGTAGSLQIMLNRGTPRRSHEGLLFRLRPLLLVGHWVSKLQDARGVGDSLELIATKAAA